MFDPNPEAHPNVTNKEQDIIHVESVKYVSVMCTSSKEVSAKNGSTPRSSTLDH